MGELGREKREGERGELGGGRERRRERGRSKERERGESGELGEFRF